MGRGSRPAHAKGSSGAGALSRGDSSRGLPAPPMALAPALPPTGTRTSKAIPFQTDIAPTPPAAPSASFAVPTSRHALTIALALALALALTASDAAPPALPLEGAAAERGRLQWDR